VLGSWAVRTAAPEPLRMRYVGEIQTSLPHPSPTLPCHVPSPTLPYPTPPHPTLPDPTLLSEGLA
jgi:hypothetical protein